MPTAIDTFADSAAKTTSGILQTFLLLVMRLFV